MAKQKQTTKAEYLADQKVKAFSTWLSEVIAGGEKINFGCNNPKGQNSEYLYDAFLGYRWLDANFVENKLVLDSISQGLMSSVSDSDLARWAKATMEWGGVKNGNNKWIDKNQNGLKRRVEEVINFVGSNNDDVNEWMRSAKHQNGGLKFNAGWTKVYSLMTESFIIYDSRVAAALSWLVKKWSGSETGLNLKQNDLIAFGCLPPKEGSNPKRRKIRTPDPNVFRKISTANVHLRWNIRANWLLEKSYADSRNPRFSNLREIEAALFMLGYDLDGSF